MRVNLICVINKSNVSIVCSLIDSDMRHHSGQNVVDSGGVAELSPQQISTSKKMFSFSSARDQKRDTLTRVACLDSSYREISQISGNCGKI